ncbi:TonB-linked outer membrane protein, SusC/RagA family [Sinomicrobium oceani]|uniref:TonB-linked outer membrane protein, SusC/RagA family n=1 Tax=Sinomicrobium oceani TaxID=1150368 RepID=A0A1K1M4R0_9FLAO|nr:SusC/RagA family TonB-linked outer membrane protein [Sinomicrobium oceani]SFW18099.1 TonB-linked outer membrane protein, SusC/RagA family [Sinomicrobium oceani]
MKKLINRVGLNGHALKFDLKMRLTLLLLFISLFRIEASSYSQNIRVSVDLEHVTVEEFFRTVESMTSYRFLYNHRDVNVSRIINVYASKEPLSGVLKKVFGDTDISYKVVDHQIVLNTLSPVEKTDDNGKLQKKLITGTVRDKNGMPLLGVTVLIKGTQQGTTTDEDGKFSIAAEEDDVLVFSYIGFLSREIQVEAEQEINIRLIEQTNELGEVTVTGYQTISSERTTGAFTKLKSEDFKSQRLNSLDAVLAGRIVGYQDGVIRGVTSMNGLTTPLYVIDGFPVEKTRYNENYGLEENLPDLNIEDIESITVLKDAAAASIYGARAANGVVVITTKKAKAGETNISFSSNLTVSPYRFYTGNLTNSADIIALEREWALGNPNLGGTDGTSASYASSLLENAVYGSQGMQALLHYYAGNITESELNGTLDQLGTAGYRYYDDIARHAKRDQYYQQYNVSFGKASQKNSFNASVTYKNNTFEDRYSEENSLGINLKNSTKITDWLDMDLGAYIHFNNEDLQTFDPLNPGFVYQPYNRLVNADDSPFVSTAASRYNRSTLQSIDTYNLYSMDIVPMDELGRNLKKHKNFLSRTYAKFNVKLSDAFSYNAMFQYEYGVERISQLKDKNSYAVRQRVNGLVTLSSANNAVFNLPYGDISFRGDQYTNAYNFRQQINFDKFFEDIHQVSVIAGTELRHSKLEYSDYTRYGYDSQTLTYTPVNQADLLQAYGSVFGGYMSQNDFSVERELLNRYFSVYGNAGYTYDGKYNITGSLRWDRSNLWGTDNKYQNRPTWSAGAGWNIHNESFFSYSRVDMLKLRFSYGIGGNVAKNSAPYLTAYYNSNNNVGGVQGSINSRPNPQLSWEKTTTANLGIDFALFNNRLNGTIDVYNKKGEDLLANSMGVPTEGWGYSTYTLNNGEMTNKGIEISLSGSILSTEDFSWNAGILYAYNKNKVNYVNVEAPVYYLQLDYPSAYPRVGKNFNSIYGYSWAGLSSTGLPQVYDADGQAVSSNPADLEAIEDFGTTVPVQSGSFNTSVSYKNFSLSALFIYELGHKIRNTFLPMFGNSYSGASGGYIANIRPGNKRIRDRWINPGDEAHTDVPRVVYEYDTEYSYDLQSIYSYADVNILNASNLRLSNVSLAYQTSALAPRLGIENVRINFNVENVFTVAANRDVKYLLGGYRTPNFVLGLHVNL